MNAAAAPLPRHVPLAVTSRGGAPENVHYGSIAVTDADGNLLAAAGDADAMVFARSTLKPLQALPFVAAGGLARFGWGSDEAALLCASHSGAPEHLAVVGRMLASAGLGVDDLRCGSHAPLALAAELAAPAGEWTPLHNNCSGKHAGFLAYCRWRGWPLADYLDPQHPLQVAIRRAIGDFADVDGEALPLGIDGCSAPAYALPLRALALSWARLGAAAATSPFAGAAQTLREAMCSRPRLVSGDGRADLVIAEAGRGDWIAKGGAEGVQAIAAISRGLGIAIKLADGNARALQAVTVETLRQLGLVDAGSAAALAPFDRPPIRNWRGTETGRLEACLILRT